MRGHEFKGSIADWPEMKGEDVATAIIKTLNEYDGDNDYVYLELFIVPVDSQIRGAVQLLGVDAKWDENYEAWKILRYR